MRPPPNDSQLNLRALGAAGRAGVSTRSGLRGRDEAALRPCSAAGEVVGPGWAVGLGCGAMPGAGGEGRSHSPQLPPPTRCTNPTRAHARGSLLPGGHKQRTAQGE